MANSTFSFTCVSSPCLLFALVIVGRCFRVLWCILMVRVVSLYALRRAHNACILAPTTPFYLLLHLSFSCFVSLFSFYFSFFLRVLHRCAPDASHILPPFFAYRCIALPPPAMLRASRPVSSRAANPPFSSNSYFHTFLFSIASSSYLSYLFLCLHSALPR